MSGLIERKVSLLDYGAGNVRSLRNAIKFLGFEVVDIISPGDIEKANAIIFPGVGNFGQAMQSLESKGFMEPLKAFVNANRPFFGICIGMQALFEGSDESLEDKGVGIIPGRISKFDASVGIRVPHIGWNGYSPVKESMANEGILPTDKVYFVHSFCALPTIENLSWILSVTDYGPQRYISMVQRGNVLGCQFHPEKSGHVGLRILSNFLSRTGIMEAGAPAVPVTSLQQLESFPRTALGKRIVACLDVRSNDHGDLVVTKGDQYDVRETVESGTGNTSRGNVRNLGKPVALCRRYYENGADEVAFLNITSFRSGVISDMPMLQVLEQSSENVFVPLTVGGGIRGYTDDTGVTYSALDVAARYFRAGADKVSIGSDAVTAAEEYYISGGMKTGSTCIEQISSHYGAQAVVVSVDPKRMYVSDPSKAPVGKTVMALREKSAQREEECGPQGERYCWWAVTVKGGREIRDLDAVQLVKASEALGAGEIMVNCIDMDGQCRGFDVPLLKAMQAAVTIPVIASSGAGTVEHFSEVFRETDVHAALAAGIFHREEVKLSDVKAHLKSEKIPCR
mmetsp:Transcript_26144/g.26372  ORF Transcript_26144/g.26372 Transcript_26144/m.26372 type:complete len:568 (+) Transcript_26144:70-1773(+)